MGTDFTRRFEADRIGSQVPIKLMHLEGLYELFISKFVSFIIVPCYRYVLFLTWINFSINSNPLDLYALLFHLPCIAEANPFLARSFFLVVMVIAWSLGVEQLAFMSDFHCSGWEMSKPFKKLTFPALITKTAIIYFVRYRFLWGPLESPCLGILTRHANSTWTWPSHSGFGLTYFISRWHL